MRPLLPLLPLRAASLLCRNLLTANIILPLNLPHRTTPSCSNLLQQLHLILQLLLCL
jgi:hypothetical protein